MIHRITNDLEFDETFTSAKDVAETLYSEIEKYRSEVGDMHTWKEWQMAMQMLGNKLLHPCQGFRLPPLEDV